MLFFFELFAVAHHGVVAEAQAAGYGHGGRGRPAMAQSRGLGQVVGLGLEQGLGGSVYGVAIRVCGADLGGVR